LAEILTNEHITPMVLAKWSKIEELILKWEADGKPEPTDKNQYAWAFYEAQGDPDKTPSDLMEVQLTNAKRWRGLQIAFSIWQQDFNSRVRLAQTEDELNTLRSSMFFEIKTVVGL